MYTSVESSLVLLLCRRSSLVYSGCRPTANVLCMLRTGSLPRQPRYLVMYILINAENSILLIKFVSKMTYWRDSEVQGCACVGGACSFATRARVTARIDVERAGC